MTSWSLRAMMFPFIISDLQVVEVQIELDLQLGQVLIAGVEVLIGIVFRQDDNLWRLRTARLLRCRRLSSGCGGGLALPSPAEELPLQGLEVGRVELISSALSDRLDGAGGTAKEPAECLGVGADARRYLLGA